jgi:hypothetical protein
MMAYSIHSHNNKYTFAKSNRMKTAFGRGGNVLF